MKKSIVVVALVAASAMLSGCIVIAGGDRVVHDATTIERTN